VDNAVWTAMTRRGIAHLCMPNDIQIANADDDPYAHPAPAPPQHGSPMLPRRFGVPEYDQLATAADVLNTAERPAILAGVGARGA
jgi:pyruvate dehydrogenase (quinone)